jgi:hypothetical protein
MSRSPGSGNAFTGALTGETHADHASRIAGVATFELSRRRKPGSEGIAPTDRLCERCLTAARISEIAPVPLAGALQTNVPTVEIVVVDPHDVASLLMASQHRLASWHDNP